MRVRLIYEYEIKESDGCGTHNDAYITAVGQLENALDDAYKGLTGPWKMGSTEDLIDVFKAEIID